MLTTVENFFFWPFSPSPTWMFEEPPPANVQYRRATRQNYLNITAPTVITPPETRGGPNVWRWAFLNTGTGDMWLRWDGLGFAAVNGEHSMRLPAGATIEFRASVVTIAGTGHAAFTAENVGHDTVIGRER